MKPGRRLRQQLRDAADLAGGRPRASQTVRVGGPGVPAGWFVIQTPEQNRRALLIARVEAGTIAFGLGLAVAVLLAILLRFL